MKKSKMILKLANYLKKRDQHIGLTKDTALQLAVNALCCLEKQGMNPPSYEPFEGKLLQSWGEE